MNQSLHLDEYGLWRWNPTDPEKPSLPSSIPNSPEGHWELLESESEDAILDTLDMNIPSDRRNYLFLLKRYRKKDIPFVTLPKDKLRDLQRDFMKENMASRESDSKA